MPFYMSVWGIFIGLFYFGGLFITVSRLPRQEKAAPFFITSFFLRLGVSIGAAWVMIGGRVDMPMRLAWILAGFFAVRIVLTQLAKKQLQRR